jgi:predicted ATPase
VARRRDTRIFGPGPYVLGLRGEGGWGSGFPFDVPAVAAVEEVKLDRPVTLLAGENGSGKSTILEAVAESIGFGDEGGELALLAIIARAVSVGAQFVVATHSPILLACRDARIYELDGTGVATPDYDDLQAVSLTRGFLAAPERYLRALDSDALEEEDS